MSASKNRLNWADIMKGLGMFVIIFSHFPHPQWTNIFYSPFALAVYFFVSGYFFSSKNSFGEFVVNKFWKLLVPLFLFGSLGVLESVLIGGESLVDRVSGMFLQIAGKADTMWFFSCLFTSEIIFYWVYKAANKVAPDKLWTVVAFSVIVLIIGIILCEVGVKLPWHIETACMVEPLLLFGYLCRKLRIEEKLSAKLCAAAWLLYIVFIYLLPNPVDVHINVFANTFLFYLQAAIGAYAVFSLSVLLDQKRNPVNDFVIWVGQNTVQYFFFQGTIIVVICKLLAPVGIAFEDSFVLVLLGTIFVYIITCIPSYIVRRYFPIFLGKR